VIQSTRPAIAGGAPRRGRIPSALFKCLAAAVALIALPHEGAEADARLEFRAHGVNFVALPKDPNKTFDTKLLKGSEGLKKIEAALGHLISKSPFSAKMLETLKKSGNVTLVYLPGDAPKSEATGENIAVFLPDFLPEGANRRKSFLVVVGRHGVKWPVKELSAVLAHELVGHGMQLERGRIGKLRPIDLECEAYLYEEFANQDLGLNKRTSEMVRFRQALEGHWCADFKAYMRKHQRKAVSLWDKLNPNIPKLLEIFEAYLRVTTRKGS
jgi:hypothetical protein